MLKKRTGASAAVGPVGKITPAISCEPPTHPSRHRRPPPRHRTPSAVSFMASLCFRHNADSWRQVRAPPVPSFDCSCGLSAWQEGAPDKVVIAGGVRGTGHRQRARTQARSATSPHVWGRPRRSPARCGGRPWPTPSVRPARGGRRRRRRSRRWPSRGRRTRR